MGPNEITTFVIKGCSRIVNPSLIYIFNFSVTSETLPSLLKQAAAVPVFF
jgi:hypothetical protein